jgi:hypothetical protein
LKGPPQKPVVQDQRPARPPEQKPQRPPDKKEDRKDDKKGPPGPNY